MPGFNCMCHCTVHIYSFNLLIYHICLQWISICQTSDFILLCPGALLSTLKQLTAIINALVRGVPAVWGPVTEMLVVYTLVPTETGQLPGTTGGRGTPLLITTVQTVRLSVTTPRPGNTLSSAGTAKLIGPTGWRREGHTI